MKKIVITGATSMIGVALIKAALTRKDIETIYAVVRCDSVKTERLPIDDRIHIIECDVSNLSRLNQLITDNCDVFYHLAWPRTATYDENYEDVSSKCNNVRYLLDAVKVSYELGCTKFVGAGSQSEYGLVDEVIDENTMCNPLRADGILHLAAGRLAKNLCDSYGIDCIWMRIFSVYGVNDRNNSLISTCIGNLLENKKCSFTKSEQIWNYIYEDDIGEAFARVGECKTGSQVYCIANEECLPLKDYILSLKIICESSSELAFGEMDYPSGGPVRMNVNVSKFVSDTGWHSKVSFEQGIKNIIERKRNN